MYSRQTIFNHLSNIQLDGKPLTEHAKIEDILVKENEILIVLNAAGFTQQNMNSLESHCKTALKDLNIDIKVIFSQETSHKQPPPKASIANVKKILLVASGKGGVGKSTIAASIALSLAQQGFKTGLLDADIYGPSIPYLFDIHTKPELSKDDKMLPMRSNNLNIMSIGFLIDEGKPIIWRGPMLSKALTQLTHGVDWRYDSKDLDFLIIDTPPGTGDIHLSLATKYLIDGAIFISTPQKLAVADTMKSIEMFKELQVPILGLIENMSYLSMPDGSKQYIFGQADNALGRIAQIPLNPDLAEKVNINQHMNWIGNVFQPIVKDLLENNKALK